MVQMFYARRLLVITKNRWLVALVMTSSSVTACERRCQFLQFRYIETPLSVCAVGTSVGLKIKPEVADLPLLKVRYCFVSPEGSRSSTLIFSVGCGSTLASRFCDLRYDNCDLIKLLPRTPPDS